jgi:hypothetical protein
MKKGEKERKKRGNEEKRKPPKRFSPSKGEEKWPRQLLPSPPLLFSPQPEFQDPDS